MNTLINDLAHESPLIGWLLLKLPILAKSTVLALLITLLAIRVKVAPRNPIKLSIPIFIIMSVIVSHAPNLLNGLEHGLGFAIAILLLGEASPFWGRGT